MSNTKFSVCLFAIAFFFITSIESFSQITVNPFGITVSAENDDNQMVELTIANLAEEDIRYRILMSNPSVENQEQGGPPRDDVDLSGLMFAVFQSEPDMWFWIDEAMLSPILEEIDLENFEGGFHSYRNPEDWDEVDFANYDCIIIAASRQTEEFNDHYNDNLERFEEYISNGGAAYFETGVGNSLILSPGNIENSGEGGQNGRLVVSPNPLDENYSLFAQICHESQPNSWEEGSIIGVHALLDSEYDLDQFGEDENIKWFQVLVEREDNEVPAAVVYGYGEGTVLTLGAGPGNVWEFENEEGQWGSIAEELLFYITQMTKPAWVDIQPEIGVVEAENSEVIEITFQPEDLEEGVYEIEFELVFGSQGDEEAFPNLPSIEMSVVMSLGMPVANLAGTVTSARDGEIIENVIISFDTFNLSRATNDRGVIILITYPWEITS